MPKFQGSGFSLELPGGTVDASNYGFALPGSGGANPTLTIRITKTAHADLGAIFDDQKRSLEQALTDFEVVSKGAFKRADREYIVWIGEWGSAEARTRQKQVLMFVTGNISRLFTITATDLASHFAQTEPLFDGVIRTFEPNDIQLI
jgi:hypothetical protein